MATNLVGHLLGLFFVLVGVGFPFRWSIHRQHRAPWAITRRLAHAWNLKHPERRMGLLHVVFAAFNTGWRRSTMAYLDPVDRMGALALDALLGQLEGEPANWSQRWAIPAYSLGTSR